MSTFQRVFQVGWGDMDFNAHMKNTSYLDRGADVRMMFFAEQGFPMREFERLQIGPVILRDDVEYFKEMRLLEPFTVNLLLVGLSPDASRFAIRNEFHREDGKLAARVTSTGSWFDLGARRLTEPPEKLAEALRAIPRTDDFQELESSVRRGAAEQPDPRGAAMKFVGSIPGCDPNRAASVSSEVKARLRRRHAR